MAQKTFVSAVLTSADVNTFLAGEGGAWQTWSPTVTQSGAVAATNTRSRFARYGRTIHFVCHVQCTGTGTAANEIRISLPVTAAASFSGFGSGYMSDASDTALYPAVLNIVATTEFALMNATTSQLGQNNLGAAVFTAALANGDVIRIGGTYEAAA